MSNTDQDVADRVRLGLEAHARMQVDLVASQQRGRELETGLRQANLEIESTRRQLEQSQAETAQWQAECSRALDQWKDMSRECEQLRSIAKNAHALLGTALEEHAQTRIKDRIEDGNARARENLIGDGIAKLSDDLNAYQRNGGVLPPGSPGAAGQADGGRLKLFIADADNAPTPSIPHPDDYAPPAHRKPRGK